VRPGGLYPSQLTPPPPPPGGLKHSAHSIYFVAAGHLYKPFFPAAPAQVPIAFTSWLQGTFTNFFFFRSRADTYSIYFVAAGHFY